MTLKDAVRVFSPQLGKQIQFIFIFFIYSLESIGFKQYRMLFLTERYAVSWLTFLIQPELLLCLPHLLFSYLTVSSSLKNIFIMMPYLQHLCQPHNGEGRRIEIELGEFKFEEQAVGFQQRI